MKNKCKCGECNCSEKSNNVIIVTTGNGTDCSPVVATNGGYSGNSSIDREEYYKDLKKRQEEHLRGINGSKYGSNWSNWQPCLHDQCPDCLGTGIKHDGSLCIHMISCPCPKCSPQCMC